MVIYGDNLIEVETISNNSNINTIEKLKTQIINLQISVDTSNFFVKKVEIKSLRLVIFWMSPPKRKRENVYNTTFHVFYILF